METDNTEMYKQCHTPRAVSRYLQTSENVCLLEAGREKTHLFPVTLGIWSLPQTGQSSVFPCVIPSTCS